MNYGPLEFAAYLQRGGRPAQAVPEPACVRELIATGESAAGVRVLVRHGARPLVLVLSSHEAVDWQIELQPGARLEAVMLAGPVESSVRGARGALITFIGDPVQLEDEVMRCTRREIRDFQSLTAGQQFEISAY